MIVYIYKNKKLILSSAFALSGRHFFFDPAALGFQLKIKPTN